MGTLLHAVEAGDEDDEDLTASEQRALEKNRRLSDDFVAHVLSGLGIFDPGEPVIYREREFFLNDQSLQPVFPPIVGHADEVRWYPQHGVSFIFDSKFGRYPVARAEMNDQLRCYAPMIHDEFGGDWVYPAIRQPYLPAPDDFHAAEYAAEDIRTAREELLRVIAATQEDNAPRRASEDACAFCRARGTPICPESIEWVRSVRRAEVDKLKPSALEALAQEMLGALRTIENWKARMGWVAEHFPELLKEFELSDPQTIEQCDRPLQLCQVLEVSTGVLVEDMFIEKACKVSLPKLYRLLSEVLNISGAEAKDLVHRTAGTFRTGEEKDDSLIELKQKQRFLKPRKKR